MQYKVEIIETLSRTEDVDAESKDDAISIVMNRHSDEGIVLDAEDFVDVKFKIQGKTQ